MFLITSIVILVTLAMLLLFNGRTKNINSFNFNEIKSLSGGEWEKLKEEEYKREYCGYDMRYRPYY